MAEKPDDEQSIENGRRFAFVKIVAEVAKEFYI